MPWSKAMYYIYLEVPYSVFSEVEGLSSPLSQMKTDKHSLITICCLFMTMKTPAVSSPLRKFTDEPINQLLRTTWGQCPLMENFVGAGAPPAPLLPTPLNRVQYYWKSIVTFNTLNARLSEVTTAV